MIKYIQLLPVFFVLASCSSDLTESKENKVKINTAEYITEHFNITIASDLSNRLNQDLYPRAVSDVDIVSILSENMYPKILTYKRSMNQLDQFRIGFINKKQISAYIVNTPKMDIDFSRFQTQAERINYLRTTFKADKKQFMNEFNRVHNKATSNPFGSDIWTYMQQDIDNFIVNEDISTTKIGIKGFKNKYKNVLILLTDGYIETKFTGKGFDLTGKRIADFRTQYLKSKEKNIESFYKKNPQYKIKPLNNPLLKELEILVLELYDRTETNSGASVHPTDLEIMKLIWSDWLKNSKLKRVELHSKFSSKAEAEKVIMKFLGI